MSKNNRKELHEAPTLPTPSQNCRGFRNVKFTSIGTFRITLNRLIDRPHPAPQWPHCRAQRQIAPCISALHHGHPTSATPAKSFDWSLSSARWNTTRTSNTTPSPTPAQASSSSATRKPPNHAFSVVQFASAWDQNQPPKTRTIPIHSTPLITHLQPPLRPYNSNKPTLHFRQTRPKAPSPPLSACPKAAPSPPTPSQSLHAQHQPSPSCTQTRRRTPTPRPRASSSYKLIPRASTSATRSTAPSTTAGS